MEQTFEARFLSARRAVIAARFQNLNEMQREGVLTTQGPLLLLAGAGSGKTTVLINRIANLIAFGEGSDSNEIPEYIAEEDVTYLEDYLKTRDPAMQQQAERLCALRPAAPWSILTITFTNKAANELKARLQALLGDYAMDVWAMTFHAACCRILRREIGRLDGYTGRFTIAYRNVSGSGSVSIDGAKIVSGGSTTTDYNTATGLSVPVDITPSGDYRGRFTISDSGGHSRTYEVSIASGGRDITVTEIIH